VLNADRIDRDVQFDVLRRGRLRTFGVRPVERRAERKAA
jgi:hypothetical protein